MIGRNTLRAVCTAALIALALPASGGAQAPEGTNTLNDRLTGAITPVHDPVIIREGQTYHVYNTIGRYIGEKTSTDLVHWVNAGPVFDTLPAWATKAVPGTEGIWAPDISYENGEYRLYYAVSTFGSNRSAVGLATSPTLDRSSANYHWTDHGLVVMSTEADDFNAIDPNFVKDAQGGQWLTLGSFWTGIKLFRLDPKTGKPASGTKPISLARRPVPAGAPDAIEAPFILPHGGWYYLLTSFDYCCKGVNSTYYTVISRSRSVTGPYLGKDGSKALEGGGSVLVRADLKEKGRFRGPGHPGAFTDTDGTTYLVYHAYDKQHEGAPTLRIAPLIWGADGWPVARY
ncbi:arabinan endo-1,5-alpha-L-arabinosidase [Novosphingobium sp. 9]|uniref:arabinan endo-1,5-alpha-L-arabinosidase n=1 Tax=Novosphingobium sp. 9 TaxID=2025349 RepID=UPI0021B4E382|nr:arabinan endo-1,5-alpha-L-arabinosidase [Novosphingobium sp. 9]